MEKESAENPSDFANEIIQLPRDETVANKQQLGQIETLNVHLPDRSGQLDALCDISASETASRSLRNVNSLSCLIGSPSSRTSSDDQDLDASPERVNCLSSDHSEIDACQYDPVSDAASSGSGSSEEQVMFSLWNLSREQKYIMFCVCITTFTETMSLSILVSFFPVEAAERNINSAISGWIFGTFALVQAVTSPIFGLLLPYTGDKFQLVSGQFLNASSTILFGVLGYMTVKDHEDTVVFITLCVLLRTFLALGATAINIAAFSLSANAFDNLGYVFGVEEVFTGLGMMLGPFIGGLLYDAGGFTTPFFVLGSFMMCLIPLSLILLKDLDLSAPPGEHKCSAIELLRQPPILMTTMCVFLAAVGITILDPILEPHLNDYYHVKNSTYVGLLFLCMAITYSVGAPIVGKLSDKISDSSLLMSIGFFLSALSFLLLGPSPFLFIPDDYRKLWLVILSIAVSGLGLSFAIVPTMEKIFDAAEIAGFNDNIALYGAVAGIWSTANALGEFIGPTFSGYMVTKTTFSMTITYYALASFAMAVVVLLVWLKTKRNRQNVVRNVNIQHIDEGLVSDLSGLLESM